MPAIGVSWAGRLSLFVLAAASASAQIYPPGGYPPVGYPGRVSGGYPVARHIPFPAGRGKPQPNSSTKGQPLPSFRGKLKQMDAKSILLALDDDRLLDFTRNTTTKFFKDGAEIKDPTFNVNDELSIEGPEDNAGFLTAVNVYWEKAAGSATTTTDAKSKDKTPDAWADAPSQTHGTEAAPPPAKHDSDDPGPPTLQHGKAADPAREKSAPLPPDDAASTTNAQSGRLTGRRSAQPTGRHPPRLPQYVPTDDGSGGDAIQDRSVTATI